VVMRGLRIGIVAAAFAAIGCDKREVRYDDDLDLGAIKAAFKCGPALTGDRAHACRMLDEFASAAPFAAWPAKGLESWFGRKVCTDAIDAPDRMDFGQVHLKPGLGKAIFPSDAKVDATRDVPHGAPVSGTSASKVSADTRRGYLERIAAAEKGAPPSFTGIPDFERTSLELMWKNAKVPGGTSDHFRLVRSKGTSVLGGPLTTGSDSVKTPSATYFVRGKDKRMLVVYPSWTSPAVPCVAELWKIHVEP
jgi:hypothetical protein